jgi:hypothetical protein
VLFAVQACVLLVVAACIAPDGWLMTFAIEPPIVIDTAWRWYLHLGSFALVPAFLLIEYLFRRWWLRHLAHAPLHHFVARLARCWPALVRSFVEDGPRSGR